MVSRYPKAEKPSIAMAPCKSKSVAAAGYDLASRTLALRFRNGTTYHYAGVPAEVAAALATADSVGKFVQAQVKGKYRAEKQ